MSTKRTLFALCKSMTRGLDQPLITNSGGAGSPLPDRQRYCALHRPPRRCCPSRIRVDESMELESLEVISSMVFYDLGVSIVPHRSVPSPHPLPLKRIPLQPMAKSRILGVVSRKDSTKFRLIHPLVKELTEIVEAAGQVSVIRTFETKDSEG